MKRIAFAIICALLVCAFAFAHGNMEHIMGTVSAMTDHSLSVKTQDGTVKTVEFDANTRFTKGEAAATIKDVHVGDRVAIHAHKNGDSLHAAEVKIGSGGAKAHS